MMLLAETLMAMIVIKWRIVYLLGNHNTQVRTLTRLHIRSLVFKHALLKVGLTLQKNKKNQQKFARIQNENMLIKKYLAGTCLFVCLCCCCCCYCCLLLLLLLLKFIVRNIKRYKHYQCMRVSVTAINAAY